MLKITKENLTNFLKKVNMDIYETNEGKLCLFDGETGNIIAEDGDVNTLLMDINCKVSPMMKLALGE